MLDTDKWPRSDHLCKTATDHVYNDTKNRQIRKFSTLKSQGTPQPTLETSNLVVNLSHRHLTSLEEEVLALGLSFAIAPSSIPFEDIIAATEATARRLDQIAADTLRTEMAEVLRKAKPPKPNMSFKQRSAVRALRNDSNIVIVLADKGKATVVMDRMDYDTKLRAILQDEQYRPMPRDPTVKVKNKIADTLKRLRNQGHLDNNLCNFLTP